MHAAQSAARDRPDAGEGLRPADFSASLEKISIAHMAYRIYPPIILVARTDRI